MRLTPSFINIHCTIAMSFTRPPFSNSSIGGNGGFSLRKKEFISTILSRYAVNIEGLLTPLLFFVLTCFFHYPVVYSPGTITLINRYPWSGDIEDLYFSMKASEIYHELPDNLKPASQRENMKFSSEMMFSDRPFGVHKFWGFHSPDEPRMIQIMKQCPEMIGILPLRVVSGDRAWEKLICSLNITRDIIENATSGGSFDYVKFCHFEKNANFDY